jgi:hypothetical protein
MRNTKELLEKKITELENIKKRCQNHTYCPEALGAGNYVLRDFIEWNLKDLRKILKSI